MNPSSGSSIRILPESLHFFLSHSTRNSSSARSSRESDNGYLWLPTEPVAVMEVGAPLWTAVLNSKVVMFYLDGLLSLALPAGLESECSVRR